MRVTPKFVFVLSFLLAGLFAGVGLYSSMEHAHSRHSLKGRVYEVHYVWDNGVKSLRIVNRETGVEETDRKWRDLISTEAERYLPGLVAYAGLSRAVGRLLITAGGYESFVAQVVATTDDPDLIKDPDMTSLMSAIYDGDTVKARKLIAAGANVNAADQHGMTALMFAGGTNDASLVQLLITAGADVNAKNEDGETALFRAAFLGKLASMRELVRRGASVNAISKLGVTPLMETAQHSVSVVEFLVANGANVNTKDAHSETALMMAARAGRGDIVRALIRAGADVNAKANDGRTALDNAQWTKHDDVVKILKRAGAS
jgi:ankyrin repeat protein